MSRYSRRLRFALLVAPLLVAFLGMVSCSRDRGEAEASQVKADFESCRLALLQGRADQVVRYLPQDVNDYFVRLNSSPPAPLPAPSGEAAPGVHLLLRTALDQKVPRNLRPQLTLQLLLQRVADRGLLDSREIRGLSLGAVVVRGDRATAGLYLDGHALPLRLPFLKQNGVWKIDLLAMAPFAEVLMRLDRALTGRTQSEQVDQLVAPLPLL